MTRVRVIPAGTSCTPNTRFSSSTEASFCAALTLYRSNTCSRSLTGVSPAAGTVAGATAGAADAS